MIKETFKQAVQNVLSNKVRTFLTMLGIIIGVMAVIVIVGLGNGMTHMMQDFYSDMGSDILAVNVMTASTRTVEVNDVYNIINQKPEYYKGLSPIASAGGDTLRVAGEKYRRTGISGVNEDYMTINNYKVAKGRGIQYTDLIDNKNIYALNKLLAEMCRENGYEFVNIASNLIDEGGFLPKEYCSDNYVHQTYSAYAVWADVLRSLAARHITGQGKLVFE